MVILNKIYTKTGDDGTTGLGDGERVRKDGARVAAYGTIDEANSAIGMARIHLTAADATVDAMLLRIQNDLFDLGADLCVPDRGKKLEYEPLRITALVRLARRNGRCRSAPRRTHSHAACRTADRRADGRQERAGEQADADLCQPLVGFLVCCQSLRE
jgi:cob(I)alamin adenosyltransferase